VSELEMLKILRGEFIDQTARLYYQSEGTQQERVQIIETVKQVWENSYPRVVRSEYLMDLDFDVLDISKAVTLLSINEYT
jgi:hypothetical protein